MNLSQRWGTVADLDLGERILTCMSPCSKRPFVDGITGLVGLRERTGNRWGLDLWVLQMNKSQRLEARLNASPTYNNS